MELGIGATVGGYVLQQKLGAGGMGAVYRARHPRLDRDVALKVLHPVAGGDPEIRERFAREADALCRLDHHPNIVDVLDRGQDGDLLWMTMRYVPGSDLETAARTREAFSPLRAIEIADEVGRALDHAHAHGLLHRDVKPANVLLRIDHEGNERAVLTDFGVVKDVAASRMLTQHGAGPATVAYAAPEQLAGGPLDARADVYSLAVVLFELLTGQRAFGAQELPALMWSVVSGPVPDLHALRPDLSAALGRVLARGLAKDPSERYTSCAELVAAARAALEPAGRAPETVVRRDADVSAPPAVPAEDVSTRSVTRPDSQSAPRRRRARLAAGTGAVLAAVVVAVTVYAVTAPGADPGGAAGSDASAETASVPQDATGSESVQTLTVGTCLDEGGAVAACDAPHVAEVFSVTDCSPAELLGYLGGAVGQDVLLTAVVPQAVGAGPACSVWGPAGPMTASIADVLLGRAGDAWRRCLDEVGRETACAEPHTAEVIFERSDVAEALTCPARADAYLGRPFAQHADDLRLLDGDSGCLVEVRGDNVLTASLRRLGSGALPLEAG